MTLEKVREAQLHKRDKLEELATVDDSTSTVAPAAVEALAPDAVEATFKNRLSNLYDAAKAKIKGKNFSDHLRRYDGGDVDSFTAG